MLKQAVVVLFGISWSVAVLATPVAISTPTTAPLPVATAAVAPAPKTSVSLVAPATPLPSTLEPSRQDVLQILFRNSTMRLSEARYCAVELPNLPSPSLGDWMAKLMADMDGGENSVEIACDSPAISSPDVWTCHVDFIHADTDAHWKVSMALGVKGSDKSLVRGSLGCVAPRR